MVSGISHNESESKIRGLSYIENDEAKKPFFLKILIITCRNTDKNKKIDSLTLLLLSNIYKKRRTLVIQVWRKEVRPLNIAVTGESILCFTRWRSIQWTYSLLVMSFIHLNTIYLIQNRNFQILIVQGCHNKQWYKVFLRCKLYVLKQTQTSHACNVEKIQCNSKRSLSFIGIKTLFIRKVVCVFRKTMF